VLHSRDLRKARLYRDTLWPEFFATPPPPDPSGRHQNSTIALVHAMILTNQLAKRNLGQPGNSRFHTVWRVSERVCRTGKVTSKSGLNLS
jgi:hypothetical protein